MTTKLNDAPTEPIWHVRSRTGVISPVRAKQAPRHVRPAKGGPSLTIIICSLVIAAALGIPTGLAMAIILTPEMPVTGSTTTTTPPVIRAALQAPLVAADDSPVTSYDPNEDCNYEQGTVKEIDGNLYLCDMVNGQWRWVPYTPPVETTEPSTPTELSNQTTSAELSNQVTESISTTITLEPTGPIMSSDGDHVYASPRPVVTTTRLTPPPVIEPPYVPLPVKPEDALGTALKNTVSPTTVSTTTP